MGSLHGRVELDLAGIEATGAAGTTSLVISGGSGLPTGAGGGSSGGSGGAATSPYLQTNVYTPITTSGTSAPTTISGGSPTVVVAVNVGSTNGAYCAPGATATTSDHYLAPGGGWFAWNPNSATTLACIQAGGSTTVNVTGGSGGLPTGSGGAEAEVLEMSSKPPLSLRARRLPQPDASLRSFRHDHHLSRQLQLSDGWRCHGQRYFPDRHRNRN